jgi:hypothetical protein
MNDLGPETRALLEAARGAEAPTRADRARIKHAVLLRVATVGAASAVSTAAGGAIAMTLATKVTVAASDRRGVGRRLSFSVGLEAAHGATTRSATPYGVPPSCVPDPAYAPNPNGSRTRISGCRGRAEPHPVAARGAGCRGRTAPQTAAARSAAP